MRGRRGILEGKFAAFYSVVCARSLVVLFSLGRKELSKRCDRGLRKFPSSMPPSPFGVSAFPLYVPFAARIMMLGKCTAKWQFLPLSPIGRPTPNGRKGGGPKNGFLAREKWKGWMGCVHTGPFQAIARLGRRSITRRILHPLDVSLVCFRFVDRSQSGGNRGRGREEGAKGNINN